MLESNSFLLLQELRNKQLITEKRLNDITSNSNTAKHLSGNQKQKVQEESVKVMETTKKTPENNMFLGDSMVKWLHKYGISKIQIPPFQIQSFLLKATINQFH